MTVLNDLHVKQTVIGRTYPGTRISTNRAVRGRFKLLKKGEADCASRKGSDCLNGWSVMLFQVTVSVFVGNTIELVAILV